MSLQTFMKKKFLKYALVILVQFVLVYFFLINSPFPKIRINLRVAGYKNTSVETT